MRKAFPDEMAGTYTGDEMAQATPATETQDPPPKDLGKVVDAVFDGVPQPAEQPEIAEQEAIRHAIDVHGIGIAEEFMRMLGKCTTMAELDEMAGKIPKADMTEDEIIDARIAYGRAKAKMIEARMNEVG
jgi:hypothetical protein